MIFSSLTPSFTVTAMAQLCDSARKASVTNLPVLIEGETGTGKELLPEPFIQIVIERINL